jgi:putative methyltransferase
MKKFLLVNYTTLIEGAKDVPYLWLTLHSYFKRNSINPSAWEWLDPIYDDYAESTEELAERIVSQQPNVIGISCFVWNEKLTMAVMRRVKDLLPNVKIVAGGPALYFERDKSWFSNHQFIDGICEYAGYGEIFITEYLDGKEFKDIPFAVYPTLRGSFWNKSTVDYNKREFHWPEPYFDNIEYLKRFKQKEKNVKIILDTARGCPYGCTFCEWGGGTSTKVVFKPLDRCLAEIELAFDILQPMYVDIINANFGIIKDDYDVTVKICELHKKYNCVQMVNIYGPAKTNKKNLKKIYELFVANKLINAIKLSIQSTDETILKNIKRTDMQFDEHLTIYNDLCDKYGISLRFETMIGLPGETLETYYKTIGDVSKSTLLEPMMHEWQMLPSAPAANPEYVEEMQLKTKEFKFIRNDYDSHVLSRNAYYKFNKFTGPRHLLQDQEHIAPFEVVVSTYSYGIEDWVEMELFKFYFTFLNATKVILPIQNYLKDNGVDLAEFNKTFFKEFLMKIPVVQKSYNDFVNNVKSEELGDMFYVDLSENMPLISHYSLLRFLILMDPKQFFSSLALWLGGKYGDLPAFQQLCENISDNINTPMKHDIPKKEAIKSCLNECKFFAANLFFDNFASKY